MKKNIWLKEQGDKGIQGDIGPQGPIGNTGPIGPQGIQGIQGIQGEIGPAGSFNSDIAIDKLSITDIAEFQSDKIELKKPTTVEGPNGAELVVTGAIDPTVDYSLTSPENGDLVYHVEEDGATLGHTVHENIMSDSVYPKDGSKGIWCGEAYENLTLNEFKDGYTSSVGASNWDASYLTDISIPANTDVYLRAKGRFITKVNGSDRFTFHVFDSIGSIPLVHATVPSDGEWYDIVLLLPSYTSITGVYSYMGDAGSCVGNQIELKDVFIITIPNAPYVKDKQTASAVKIDTSSWNKDSGSFSFTLSEDLTTNYLLDCRDDSGVSDLVIANTDATRTLVSLNGDSKYVPILQAGLTYTFLWSNGTSTLYEGSTLLCLLSVAPTFYSGIMYLGNRYTLESYMNNYISNISYRNSTELMTKPAFDPRFKMNSNGSFQDDKGNWNDEVWSDRALAKATDVRTWIIGEDIPFENGWEVYATFPNPRLTKIGKIVNCYGIICNGTGVVFSLSEELRPKNQIWETGTIIGVTPTAMTIASTVAMTGSGEWNSFNLTWVTN